MSDHVKRALLAGTAITIALLLWVYFSALIKPGGFEPTVRPYPLSISSAQDVTSGQTKKPTNRIVNPVVTYGTLRLA